MTRTGDREIRSVSGRVGTYATVDPVHGPLHGPGPWTTPVDHPPFVQLQAEIAYLALIWTI